MLYYNKMTKWTGCSEEDKSSAVEAILRDYEESRARHIHPVTSRALGETATTTLPQQTITDNSPPSSSLQK